MSRGKMGSRFSWGFFSHFRSTYSRVSSLCNSTIKGVCKVLGFHPFNGTVATASLICFLLALSFAFSCMFPDIIEPVSQSDLVPEIHPSLVSQSDLVPDIYPSLGNCNVFEGSWIKDENYPLYNSSLCPFAELGFNCLANGRKDSDYTKWRWKPKDCDLPRFNARDILEKLRWKRIVFVGDSLSRQQWQSMICLLMTGVEDKKSVYEINGNQITKRIRFLGVLFSSYDLRIDFYRSVFLVQSGPKPKRSPKRVKSTLKLDKMDEISKEWVDADVLIFNSGHWWTRTKLFEMGSYFQFGGSLKLGMPTINAFKKAIETWAYWVETTIDTNRTRIFFRTYESSHWSHGCKVTREPSKTFKGRDKSEISDIIIDAVSQMSVAVTALHVTPMGAYRSDGHVGTFSDNPAVRDCSHWCLPGVPDTWNEIVFSYLLSKDGIPFP